MVDWSIQSTQKLANIAQAADNENQYARILKCAKHSYKRRNHLYAAINATTLPLKACDLFSTKSNKNQTATGNNFAKMITFHNIDWKRISAVARKAMKLIEINKLTCSIISLEIYFFRTTERAQRNSLIEACQSIGILLKRSRFSKQVAII